MFTQCFWLIGINDSTEGQEGYRVPAVPSFNPHSRDYHSILPTPTGASLPQHGLSQRAKGDRLDGYGLTLRLPGVFSHARCSFTPLSNLLREANLVHEGAPQSVPDILAYHISYEAQARLGTRLMSYGPPSPCNSSSKQEPEEVASLRPLSEHIGGIIRQLNIVAVYA